MFLVAAVALALITVPLAHGRLADLADVKLRGTPLIFAALAIQIGIVSLFPGGFPALHRVLHLASYGLAGAFLVMNHKISGVKLVALGAACNAAAIVANNGVMPASTSALRTAGEPTTHHGFINSAQVAHAKLAFLGDVFAIPKALPLHNVFSVGDVCITLGAALAVHSLTHSRLGRRADRPVSGQTANVGR